MALQSRVIGLLGHTHKHTHKHTRARARTHAHEQVGLTEQGRRAPPRAVPSRPVPAPSLPTHPLSAALPAPLPAALPAAVAGVGVGAAGAKAGGRTRTGGSRRRRGPCPARRPAPPRLATASMRTRGVYPGGTRMHGCRRVYGYGLWMLGSNMLRRRLSKSGPASSILRMCSWSSMTGLAPSESGSATQSESGPASRSESSGCIFTVE